MTSAFRIASLAVCLGCTSGPMGQPIPEESRFVKEWSRYQTLAGHKALFVAGDIDARFVMGYAHGLSSPEAAERQARADCSLRRAVRDIQHECRLYARGGERVEP